MENKFVLTKVDTPDSDRWDMYLQSLKDGYVELWKEFNEKLEAFVIDKLAEYGFTFDNRTEFFEFVKTRMKNIQYTNRPHTHDLYVDFVDGNNRGIYICTYSTKMNTQMAPDNKLNITIG